MTAPVMRLDRECDLLLQEAVDTLVTRYFQTKTAHEVGGMDRAKAIQYLVRRAAAMRGRGAIARYATAGQVPAGVGSIK